MVHFGGTCKWYFVFRTGTLLLAKEYLHLVQFETAAREANGATRTMLWVGYYSFISLYLLEKNIQFRQGRHGATRLIFLNGTGSGVCEISDK